MLSLSVENQRIVLTVVLPCFNEEEMVDSSISSIKSEVEKLNVPYEIIIVNDGSTDDSLEKLKKHMRNSTHIRTLNLLKNYGHMNALAVGYKCAKGQYVVSLDFDLQDPPNVISKLYAKIVEEKLDVVQAIRTSREYDSRFKRVTASLFYKWMSRISGIDNLPNGSDFRIHKREVAHELAEYPGNFKALRFLVHKMGYKIGYVNYTRQQRMVGLSKYKLKDMLALAWRSTLLFSAKPLRAVSLLGLSLSILSLLGIVVLFAIWLKGDVTPGWPSLAVMLVGASGLNLLVLGVIGEYIARIFEFLEPKVHINYEEVFRL